MNFLEILRTAVFALRGNWMRSALTSLGVIIGIAAVIVMVSVGQGTQAEIDKMVSGLGSQRLDISPGGGRGLPRDSAVGVLGRCSLRRVFGHPSGDRRSCRNRSGGRRVHSGKRHTRRCPRPAGGGHGRNCGHRFPAMPG